jgi:LmbE family N-acetylglucosaminyl deacetylase
VLKEMEMRRVPNPDGTRSKGTRLSRRSFALLAAGVSAARKVEAHAGPKVLAVVAHPDDEYMFAVTAYRIVHELKGTIDQVIISNGEGGYRYSNSAKAIYGYDLADESVARAHLPAIRKEETLAAGLILGIRRHYFLDQKDTGYTLDSGTTLKAWDQRLVQSFLDDRLASDKHDFILTLLPNVETHGHHKAATLLALRTIDKLPDDRRPAVLGAEAASSSEPEREFKELTDYPLTRAGGGVFEVSRLRPQGVKNALNYQIIANWVIAAHKSQGLFQMDACRHDVERFWGFQVGGARSRESVQALFERLNRA